jgi:hypothetical protein
MDTLILIILIGLMVGSVDIVDYIADKLIQWFKQKDVR